MVSLNGSWKFYLAKTENDANQLNDFFQTDYNTTSFQTIPVPSNWAVLGYEEPVYRGFDSNKASEGFYLYDFNIPKNWGDKRLLLHFGGVWSSAEIWINGIQIGKHESGYTSFSFDITGKLKVDGSNKLAVRVKQVSREYKYDVYDDWTLGGIFRDVTLEAMPLNRWLDYTVIKTTFDKDFKNADLEIKCMVSDTHEGSLPGNYPSPDKPYNLRFTLTQDHEKVFTRQIEIPAHIATSRETNMVFHVESPLHWTAETPNLYHLKIELLENGNVVQSKNEKIGFRQISVEGGIFSINGQAIKLRGINRHDEHPDVGRATKQEHWLQDIKLMKAANINYIRMAHYQHAKGFIELCDELGMYVGEEVSIGGAGNLIYDPSYAGATLVRAYETVTRDINNPSIIYWSVGNEDPLASLNLNALKFVKALDPTRPTMIPWRSETWLPKEIDLLSVHYWHPNEYDQLAGQSTRPIITTEYSHAFGVDSFGGLEARWKALTKHPEGTGGAVWMWADQGIKTPIKRPKEKYDKIVKDDEYLRIDDQGWDGVVDSYRNPTRDYWEVKSVYAQVYPTVDKVPYIAGQNSIIIPLQNDYDFTNLNTIKIKWTLKEDDKVLSTGISTISGQPHTVSNFELPIENLKTFQNQNTYYLWLDFINADGEEIVRKAVELTPRLDLRNRTLPVSKVKVTQSNTIATILVGNISYTFNANTGQLISASLGENKLITNLKPIIWHPLDRGETSVIGSKIAKKLPDLNNYTIKVIDWKIQEDSANAIIDTRVEYRINDKNIFSTNYKYTISSDGNMKVHYEILPQVETPNLPIVGMSLQSAPELTNLYWLGLGPYDAYPNKQSAPVLGVWGGAINSENVHGNKATHWIELSEKKYKIRILNKGYMEHNVSNPQAVNILSSVLGKPEKGRKPNEPALLLQTAAAKPFVGEFIIALETTK
ncbi:glycoside hydrolase family 2 TIM barrel-domain containing protein [Arcicella aurantiaca]|nr:glycoside hydrolase family 2 TIM barrel-domain containing protein [Arcicella aurantiaca]